ncbi:FmdB family zinc ribbon protein [Chloroflexota bacterium]
MPIYEYECASCGHCFEKKQRFGAEPVRVCPECQGRAERVIRAVPIIFKGSGFYVTDNRKGSEFKPAGKKKPEKEKEKEKEKGKGRVEGKVEGKVESE